MHEPCFGSAGWAKEEPTDVLVQLWIIFLKTVNKSIGLGRRTVLSVRPSGC